MNEINEAKEKAEALIKHIRHDGCDVTLWNTPDMAVKAVEEFKGIQKYVTDDGEELWSCNGSVTECDKDNALSVAEWWDEEWTTFIDGYYVIDSRTGMYQ